MLTMADVAPDPGTPVPQNNAAPRRQVTDALFACLLVFVQLALYCASFMFLGLMVMSTDSCAYEACGDQAWLNRAMYLAVWGGAALLLVAGAPTLFRIVRHRVAWFIRAIGCIAQIGLAIACWTMEMQAGPLQH